MDFPKQYKINNEGKDLLLFLITLVCIQETLCKMWLIFKIKKCNDKNVYNMEKRFSGRKT